MGWARAKTAAFFSLMYAYYESKKADAGKKVSQTTKVLEMTIDFLIGTGESQRHFINDAMAAGMKDSRQAEDARTKFYKNYAGSADLRNVGRYLHDGSFNPFSAGSNIVEQFVGTVKIYIYVTSDGQNLFFHAWNRTSATSGGYKQLPSWDRSTFGPGGNIEQNFYWMEPIDWDRLRGK